jgi:phospholipid/cholesterol/gamma-HCH transport system substrate-binding protein
METRARYILMGLFVLLITVGGFGFVYWLHNTSSVGEKAVYRVIFQGSVSGLRTGSAVSFNGVRVGEITEIKFDPQRPNQVFAVISVERKTPVRADTQVDVEIPGLMGSPSIVLKGGASDAPELDSPKGETPTLLVDRQAGRDTMQTARDVLQNIDKVLAENSAPLHSAITNFDTFSGVLARNSNRLDEIVDGLVRLTGGSTKQQQLAVYDLDVPRFGPDIKVPHGQLVIPEPTAVVALDTQRLLLRPGDGALVPVEGAQWSDTLPKLVQSKIIQSFENANYLEAGRPSDAFTANHLLLLDIRTFQVSSSGDGAAEVELSAKLMNNTGQFVAAKVFRSESPCPATDPLAYAKALNQAFGTVSSEVVLWTLQSLAAGTD